MNEYISDERLIEVDKKLDEMSIKLLNRYTIAENEIKNLILDFVNLPSIGSQDKKIIRDKINILLVQLNLYNQEWLKKNVPEIYIAGMKEYHNIIGEEIPAKLMGEPSDPEIIKQNYPTYIAPIIDEVSAYDSKQTFLKNQTGINPKSKLYLDFDKFKEFYTYDIDNSIQPLGTIKDLVFDPQYLSAIDQRFLDMPVYGVISPIDPAKSRSIFGGDQKFAMYVPAKLTEDKILFPMGRTEPVDITDIIPEYENLGEGDSIFLNVRDIPRMANGNRDLAMKLFYQNIVHEVTHAHQFYQGRDITSIDKDELIKELELKAEAEANKYTGSYKERMAKFYEDVKSKVGIELSPTEKLQLDNIAKKWYESLSEALKSIYRDSEYMIDKRVALDIRDKFLEGGFGQNIREAIGNVANEFRDRGMISLTDKAGRKWTMQRYASTLLRTEAIKTYNEGIINQGFQYGVTVYEWLAGIDDRTCINCLEQAGEIFDFNGKYYPKPEFDIPLHPSCRCRWLPRPDLQPDLTPNAFEGTGHLKQQQEAQEELESRQLIKQK